MRKHSNMTTRLVFFYTSALSMLGAVSVYAASYVWTGAAGDGLWTTPENWQDEAVPITSSATYVYFQETATGSTTYLVNDVRFGKLSFQHPRGTTHTIDLGGGNLTVAGEGSTGGEFSIGSAAKDFPQDCGDVVITNGTFQLGHGYLSGGKWLDLRAVMYVGKTTSTSADEGRGRVTIYGVVATTNLNHMDISFVGTGSLRDSSDSWLDLRNTRITSPLGDNTWRMLGNLRIGANRLSHGVLYLPPTLERMDIGGNLEIGSGRYDGTYGAIDFGAGSRLRELNIGGNLSLGAGGSNELINLPKDVAIAVGKPNSPSTFSMGYGGSAYGVDAELVVSNAPFTAYLSMLRVGGGPNAGTVPAHTPLSVLDLEFADPVQIGAVPNQIQVDEILVGYGRYYGAAVLKLPASVTAFEAGKLIVGGTRSASDLLFSKNSRLSSFTIREAFMMGSSITEGYDDAGGSGHIGGFPAGVEFTIGSEESPALLSIGDCSQYGRGGLNILAPTNGSFKANLSTLRLGLSRRDGSESGGGSAGQGIKGTLDLSQTTLDTFVVEGAAMIGSWTNTVAGYMNNTLGEGRLQLPAGEAEFKGALYLGDDARTSYGLLELNGTRARCGAEVEIGKTGEVIAKLDGESAGLDIRLDDEEALQVGEGGRIHVDCVTPPTLDGDAYWGLRIAGDRRGLLQGLVASGALTWDASALPLPMQQRFGIVYDEVENVTLVGIPSVHGMMIILR